MFIFLNKILFIAWLRIEFNKYNNLLRDFCAANLHLLVNPQQLIMNAVSNKKFRRREV